MQNFQKENNMYIVHVFIQVKPDAIEDFIKATIENTENSIMEEGVARFDFIQQSDDPTKFVLVEIYGSPEDSSKHKETAHYLKWRNTVANMMAIPRIGIKYNNIYPDDRGWK
jgi:(4S)-4-hydroxy-5-phosphonooxypentane-2,3-dione isomerase